MKLAPAHNTLCAACRRVLQQFWGQPLPCATCTTDAYYCILSKTDPVRLILQRQNFAQRWHAPNSRTRYIAGAHTEMWALWSVE